MSVIVDAGAGEEQVQDAGTTTITVVVVGRERNEYTERLPLELSRLQELARENGIARFIVVSEPSGSVLSASDFPIESAEGIERIVVQAYMDTKSI